LLDLDRAGEDDGVDDRVIGLLHRRLALLLKPLKRRTGTVVDFLSEQPEGLLDVLDLLTRLIGVGAPSKRARRLARRCWWCADGGPLVSVIVPHPMRFAAADIAAVARHLEDVGLDGVFVGDHRKGVGAIVAVIAFTSHPRRSTAGRAAADDGGLVVGGRVHARWPRVALALALLLSGCGAAQQGHARPLPGPQTRPPQTSNTAVYQAIPAAPTEATCRVSQLRSRLLYAFGAAGTGGEDVALRNISRRSCTLLGYPGLALLDRHRHPLRVRAYRDTSTVGGHAYVRRVTLHPGGDASFRFEFSENPTKHPTCPTVAFARVIPPNDHASLLVRLEARYLCSGFSVAPVQPGDNPVPVRH